LETKFVKNVKWIAGKRGLKAVVLHSFTHLDEARASPQFAEAFLQGAAARLRNTGYQVTLTPFGWVCEWDLSVFGESLAKVFKSL
jgi:Archaea-specific editing domain of threonyl-tRNA synthetase